ncbi:recombinase family protein [Bacillus cereus group sp. BY6-1LC]|uniref:recombinase family protein n=1 Tax=Bacillus cereus group sp. BY6-1LC TaxID=3018077 RepID=UPI0022E3CBF4|nr:recombinase family protein [Bacillus cereus group sp. BY6-1LC]MDA1802802.1 recombinase family protein [Bacillus cereus group sp. BY6-1LC]
MKIGYSRVSTLDQNPLRQIQQLKEQGCEVIYQEKTSGKTTKRKELQKMLSEMKEGDEIIVTELSRITRSLRDLFNLIEIFQEKKVQFRSLKESWIDISDMNPNSRLMLGILGAVNQFEREMTELRVREGIAAAATQGRYPGRIAVFTEKNPKMQHALKLFEEGKHTVEEIVRITGVTRSTLYRKAKELGIVRK